MGTHPNAILILVLTPEGLTRKTLKNIKEGLEEPPDESDPCVKIGGEDYRFLVFEQDYEESFQISCKEGDIAVFDMITYGYGETILWDELVRRRDALQKWGEEICQKHNCTMEIRVGANYW